MRTGVPNSPLAQMSQQSQVQRAACVAFVSTHTGKQPVQAKGTVWSVDSMSLTEEIERLDPSQSPSELPACPGQDCAYRC